jgi:hypothetical protein
VLPYLLRRLIQQHDTAGAHLLAQHHQHGPHFSRSLEWLLFTALDTDFCDASSTGTSTNGADGTFSGAAPQERLGISGDAQPTDASRAGEGGCSAGDGLLHTAFDLVRHFGQWRDVVVNVSRKTDATMWPLLFSVVGRPSALLRELLTAGQVC